MVGIRRSCCFELSVLSAWLQVFPLYATGPDLVFNQLERLRFMNEGVVRSTDDYVLTSIPSIYNEGYLYLGDGHDDWTNLGSRKWSGLDYLMRRNTSGPVCNSTIIGSNIDLPGNDLDSVPLSANNASTETCSALCCATPGCKAFLYESISTVDFNKCVKGVPCCFLKARVSRPRNKTVPGTTIVAGEVSANANLVSPPSGLRSSVPLGPLGEGSLELRADGRLADWGTIFNNAPYTKNASWAKKIDVDAAAFAIWSSSGSTLLRTHLDNQADHETLPVAQELRYSGAFPVSRLSLNDSRVSVGVRLDAYSQFRVHAGNHSPVAPIVYFSFTLSNDDAHRDTEAAVAFSLPSVISGAWSASVLEGGYHAHTLTSSATPGALTAGNITLAVLGAPQDTVVTTTVGSGLAANFRDFEANGTLSAASGNLGDGAIAAKVRVPANSSVVVTFALSWFFPNRLWGQDNLGHMYANSYDSAPDVVAKEASNAVAALTWAQAWQTLCFNNSLPTEVKDSLVNTPGAWGKTALFTRDGRWRQFESHSCSQMEPPHIHFYRALGYALFLPAIEQQTPRLYSERLLKDGTVSELFGCGCGGCAGQGQDTLDQPHGGARGDDNPVYILDVFMNWRWAKDGDTFLASVWDDTKLAVAFTLQHAEKHGLTYRQVNTNDEHGLIGDINTYNAHLYLASTAAAAEMAKAMGDLDTQQQCTHALASGRHALETLLWRGDHYQQTWCENNITSGAALQAGVLYGSLWAHVLGLAEAVGVPVDRLTSHLAQERRRNASPYGLQFVSNRTANVYGGCHTKMTEMTEIADIGLRDGSAGLPRDRNGGIRTGFLDQDVWNSHSMTHAALSLYTRLGSATDAVSVASKVMRAYQTVMTDQWDYRDTTTTYDDANGHYDPNGQPRPSVNSHYGRQTIWWAIPLALTGQQFDAPGRSLELNPHAEIGAQWPLILPCGAAIMATQGVCWQLTRVTGDCEYDQWSISVSERTLATRVLRVTDGQDVFELC